MPKPSRPSARPAAATPTDAFTLASQQLAARRPLRDAGLRQIAASLQARQTLLADNDLRARLARQPDDADSLHLHARVAAQLGQREQAIDRLQRCLALAPDFAAARYLLAQLLSQQLDFPAARDMLAPLLAAEPDHPLFQLLMAQVQESLNDGPAALTLCERLVRQHPNRVDLHIRHGHALRAVGRQADSIRAYRTAIGLQPDAGAAWWGLANLKTLRLDDADIHHLQTLLASGRPAPADRVPLQFALGKALEDQGRLSDGLAQYAQGNATMRQQISYDPQVLSRGIERNRQLYTPAFLRSRAGLGCPSTAPIFVLGRPRSGSTLLEQILASHPAIEGTAELPYIGALAASLGSGQASTFYDSSYLDRLASLPGEALQALGERYLSQAGAHRRSGRPHFIDKKPANMVHVGLIHLILPQARIIDMRRHPMACGLSMFKSYSSRGRLRLDELGRYYRDYVALMAHFDRVLPGRILRVHYEDLVDRPEATVRGLLDHLGLPFDERCLRFHETERTLLTPSSEQVRQPIHAGALDQWRQVAAELAPLAQALGSVLTNYPAVPADLAGHPEVASGS